MKVILEEKQALPDSIASVRFQQCAAMKPLGYCSEGDAIEESTEKQLSVGCGARRDSNGDAGFGAQGHGWQRRQ